MSVAEMQQFVAKNVSHVEDVVKLEKIVHLIEDDARPEITAGEIWKEIKAKHDGLMKRLAQ
jgi:hypothetical protein